MSPPSNFVVRHLICSVQFSKCVFPSSLSIYCSLKSTVVVLQDVLSGHAEISKHSPLHQHLDPHNPSAKIGVLAANFATGLTNPKRAGARIEVGCFEF